MVIPQVSPIYILKYPFSPHEGPKGVFISQYFSLYPVTNISKFLFIPQLLHIPPLYNLKLLPSIAEPIGPFLIACTNYYLP